MSVVGINIFTIIIAALAGTIAGSLWYILFLKKNSIVVTEEPRARELGKKSERTFFLSFIANLISAFALSLLFSFFNSQDFLGNAKIAGAVWLAFAVVSAIRKILIEKKSWENLILGAGHDFVSLLAMAIILAGWK